MVFTQTFQNVLITSFPLRNRYYHVTDQGLFISNLFIRRKKDLKIWRNFMVIVRIFMVFADEKRRRHETFTYRYYVIFNWSLYCPWKKRFIFPFCKNIYFNNSRLSNWKKPYISAELIAFWCECWKWGWGVTFGTIESSKDHNDL